MAGKNRGPASEPPTNRAITYGYKPVIAGCRNVRPIPFAGELFSPADRQLLLVPAGLDCDILFDGVHQTLGSGIPAGTFEHIHGTQHCFYLRACECNIRGSGGKLTLMLRANE